jgi:gliding motility-associated-like protein
MDELSNEVSNEMYPVHIFPTAGVYDVNLVATSSSGCTSSSYHPHMITVYKEPDAGFEYNPSFASLIDPEVFFTNQSHFSDNHVWIFGDGGFSYDVHPSHIYNNVGDYQVQLIVTTDNGCVDTATSVVVVDEFTFYAPTALSPDNLLWNNVFFVLGNGISTEDFSLYIFDRWGQILFETNLYSSENPAQFGWNGSFRNGEKVPVGSYTWLVYYKDGRNNKHERTGVVNVIR